MHDRNDDYLEIDDPVPDGQTEAWNHRAVDAAIELRIEQGRTLNPTQSAINREHSAIADARILLVQVPDDPPDVSCAAAVNRST